MSNRKDKQALKLLAEAMRQELGQRLRKTIRVRRKISIENSWTRGWRTVLAGLGLRGPRLELYYCHWADPKKRRVWYGLYSPHPQQIQRLIKKLPSDLRPKRTFSEKDIKEVEPYNHVLKVPLKAKEYGVPFFELHKMDGNKYTYYGEFDPAVPRNKESVYGISHRAGVLFEEAIKCMRSKSGEDFDDRDYSRIENRRVVRQHLARERSRFLAAKCKERDGYRCKVCTMTFEERYGHKGRYIAEAHHLVPLSRLSKAGNTHLRHMITVCANCHRMLHQLKGEAGDVIRLKRMMANR